MKEESKITVCIQKIRRIREIPPMLAINKLPELLDTLDAALTEIQERLDGQPR
ncbi:hypothetical protein [Asticcacaulis sp.]|uniref:hypothetical protein n=1 Tax=Asticcacaulis sp. TaxID=1872648 RepID=UPI0026356C0A|nr:hypothetical protein [Asticcacaulis sp.]